MSAEADAVLEEAYRILSEQREWCQGALGRDEHGNELKREQLQDRAAAVCTVGAIRLAVERRRSGIRAEIEAEQRVQLIVADPPMTSPCSGDVGEWNDLPWLTKEDVLLALKRARWDFGSDE